MRVAVLLANLYIIPMLMHTNLICNVVGTENETDSVGKHLFSYFSSFPMVVLLIGISNIRFNEMIFSIMYSGAYHINAHATNIVKSVRY